ncbi:MAG: FMN-binding protein [Bacillota bacterium]
MKTPYKIILIVLLLFVLSAGGIFTYLKYFKEIPEVEVGNINLSQLEDGTYEGKYSVDLINVVTRVEINNGQIRYIEILEHDNGLGGKAERLIEDILSEQSLNVDTVSGATISSKAILKSVELALSK